MNTSYAQELDAAVRAARRAGEMIRADFYREEGARGLGSHADIDEEAENEIRRILMEVHPTWSYKGEETGVQENKEGDSHLWLVDPNDGTSACLEGYRGSAVSIALTHRGKLVLGVVYAPLAPDDMGDLFTWAEGCGPMQRNGREIPCRTFPDKAGPLDIVFVSHKADTLSELNARLVHPARFIAVPGIAYRLALAAAGDGIAAVTLNSPTDYDFAGGHALLRAVGGTFIGKDGLEISYEPGKFKHSCWYFGGSPGVVEELRKKPWDSLLGRTPRERGDYDLLSPRKKRKEHAPGVLGRAHGCLMGQLAGDALGSLVEFMEPAAIQKKYPHGVRELRDGGTFNTIAGQPTDDSEMALILARSVIKAGAYDPEEAAKAYVHWYRSAPFDCGGTTSRALSALADSPEESALSVASRAASGESQANGSLMRISPLGILGFALPPDESAGYAREDSRLTHPHRVCQDACALLVVAIARGIALGKGADDVYRFALDYAETSASPEAAKSLRDAASAPPPDYNRQMGWVLIALHNAFYQLLHAESIEEGIVDTIMKGGDTDTNAAIAGSLLGAVHGRSAIPRSWQLALLSCRPEKGLSNVFHPRPRPFWPVDVLEIAEQLLEIGSRMAQ